MRDHALGGRPNRHLLPGMTIPLTLPPRLADCHQAPAPVPVADPTTGSLLPAQIAQPPAASGTGQDRDDRRQPLTLRPRQNHPTGPPAVPRRPPKTTTPWSPKSTAATSPRTRRVPRRPPKTTTPWSPKSTAATSPRTRRPTPSNDAATAPPRCELRYQNHPCIHDADFLIAKRGHTNSVRLTCRNHIMQFLPTSTVNSWTAVFPLDASTSHRRWAASSKKPTVRPSNERKTCSAGYRSPTTNSTSPAPRPAALP